MMKRNQLIAGVCGLCVLTAIVVFWATRMRTPDREPLPDEQATASSPLQQRLRNAVASAKKGDRTELERYLSSINGDVNLPPVLLPTFTSFLNDKDAQVQLVGARGLFLLKDPKSQSSLIAYLKANDLKSVKTETNDPNELMQLKWKVFAVSEALAALCRVADESTVPVLESFADFQFPFESWDPLSEALARLGSVKSFAKVGPGASKTVRYRANATLRRIRDPNKVPELMAIVRDARVAPDVGLAAMESLGEINPPGIARLFVEQAAWILAGKTRDPLVEKPLLDAAKDPNIWVRGAALTGLVLYNPQFYFGRWFDTIMDTREDPGLRIVLPDRGVEIPPDLLRGQREQLYRCLNAEDRDGRPHDAIRVKAWGLIGGILAEEPPIVLSSPSSEYVSQIRNEIVNRLVFRLHRPHSQVQEEANEKVGQLVSFSAQSREVQK
jgi:HEAT repeat protein